MEGGDGLEAGGDGGWGGLDQVPEEGFPPMTSEAAKIMLDADERLCGEVDIFLRELTGGGLEQYQAYMNNRAYYETLQGQLEEATNENAALRRQLAAVEGGVTADRRAADGGGEVVAPTGELAEATRRLIELNKQHEGEIEWQRLEIERLRAEGAAGAEGGGDDVLRNQLEAMRRTLRAMTETVTSAQDMAQAEATAGAKAQEDLRAALSRIRKLEGDVTALTGERDEGRAALEASRGEAEAARRERDEGRAALEASRGEAEAARRERDESRGEAASARGELEGMKAKLAEGGKDVERERASAAKAVADGKKRKAQVDEMQREVKKARSELEASDKELKAAKTIMSSMRERERERDDTIKSKQTFIHDLKDELYKLRNTLASQAGSIGKLTLMLQESEGKGLVLRRDMAALRSALGLAQSIAGGGVTPGAMRAACDSMASEAARADVNISEAVPDTDDEGGGGAGAGGKGK